MPDQPTDDKTSADRTPATPARPPRPSRSADAAARAAAAEAAGEKSAPAAKSAPAKPAAAAPAAKPAPAVPAAAEQPAARPSRAAMAAEAASEADRATETAPRDELRRQWKDEAQTGTSAHDKKVRRFLLRLSLLNWGIAIVAWTISAALGIKSPASIIVYSVLFVIGLVAAILAILTYLLEKFGHEAAPMGAISGDEGEGGAAHDAAADTAAPAAS
jgi:hypothetical protein